MPTLEELLKYKQPEAIDQMQDVANSSWADKFAKNPTELTGEQLDALNQSPELLDKLDKAKQVNSTPVPKPQPIVQPEVPVSSKLDNVMTKLQDLPDEALGKMGSLGERIMASRAAGLVGKVAASAPGQMVGKVLNSPITGGLGTVYEGSQLAKDLKKGDQAEAMGHGLGTLAGGLATFGSGLAIPAVGAQLAFKGGQKGAEFQKEYLAKHPEIEMDDKGNFTDYNMGRSPLNKFEPKMSDSVQPRLTSVEEPSGMGPILDKEKYGSELNTEKQKVNFEDALNKGFDALLDTESGNRQLASDGTPITSSKGAIGAAQVMPATAPEAAKLAGLPWDKEKYQNDADYNKALGKAYFRKQLENNHGNFAEAYAAYNAGPGALKRAKAKAIEAGSPEDWVSFLPDETKDYVAKNMAKFNGEELTPRGIGPVSDPKKYAAMMDEGNQDQNDIRQILASLKNEKSEQGSDLQNSLKEMLAQNGGGFTNNTVENLRKVQEEYNKARELNQGLRIANTFAAGLTGGKNAALKPNQELFDESDKIAGEKVSQFKDLTAKEADDAGSQGSKQAVGFAAQILAKAGFDPKLVQGMSYNQIEKNFPQIAKMMDVKLATDARKDATKEKQKEKDKTDQERAMLQTGQLLESARGNPAAAQAEKDLYAADKAKSLASLYGDPNKLNPAMTQLLATEVAKIASGGVPTMHELEGLNPQTLKGKFAGVWEKLVNHPTPANAGAFIKQYQDYAGALTKDAQKVIHEKYGRVIESRKSQLSDQDYKALEDKYLKRFESPEISKQQMQSSNTKTVVKKGYNPKTNQTQLIYSDGSKEIVDGKR